MATRKYHRIRSGFNTRAIAGLILTTFLANACALTGEQQRAALREQYEVPADTTDHALQADIERCHKEADDSARGLKIAGVAVMATGIIVWPLLIVGAGVLGAGAAKETSANNTCLASAGYTKK
jgi:hypothetical protein